MVIFVFSFCCFSYWSGCLFVLGRKDLGVPLSSRCQDHGQCPGNIQSFFPEGSIAVASASLRGSREEV